MLKTIIHIFTGVFITTVLLSGCASDPKQKTMIGSGSFNQQEAAKTRISLGLTYLQNGNFPQAKFNLDKALEFAPRSGDAHYAMAFYFEQVEELSLAEDAYQKALSYDSKNADIINSYGAFLCKQGNYAGAKDNFLKAVNSTNYVSTAQTYENLALCAQEQGLNQEAIDYYQSALNHQPTRGQTLFLLAQLQTEMGSFSEAKKTLWKFERNGQVSAESLYLAYTISQGLGDTKEAIGYGELLKSMYPSHPHAQKYAQQMGKFKPQVKVKTKLREEISDGQQNTLAQTPNYSTEDLQNRQSENSITIIDTTNDSVAQNQQPSSEQVLDNEGIIISETIEKNAPETQIPEVVGQVDEKLENNVDYHLVKPKENLYRISLQYNVKIQRIMEWNGITDPSSINIGMKLWVKDPNKND